MSYKSQHAVILGSGIAGLFSAEKLAEAGFDVTVVSGSPNFGEASPLAQGVICSKGLTAADSELFAAKLAGQDALFSRLASAADIPRINGIVEPFFGDDECNRILKRVYRRRPYAESGTSIERVFGEPTAILNRAKVRGWLHYPRDFWFDAESFLTVLRENLVKIGVRFKRGVARTWERRGDSWSVLCDDESIVCDDLVIATGSATDDLLRVSGFPALGLVPVHGVILRGMAPAPLPSCAFVHGSKSVACHGRQIQIGGTSSKEWQDGDLERHAQSLKDELFPFLEPGLVANVTWRALHGVRVRVKDRMPVVGPWRTTREEKPVFVLTGLYKNGLQVGEACAVHLVRVMKDEEPPAQTRLFDARRLS